MTDTDKQALAVELRDACVFLRRYSDCNESWQGDHEDECDAAIAKVECVAAALAAPMGAPDSLMDSHLNLLRDALGVEVALTDGRIRYDILHEYADEHRLDFNALCSTVRESVFPVYAAPPPEQARVTPEMWRAEVDAAYQRGRSDARIEALRERVGLTPPEQAAICDGCGKTIAEHDRVLRCHPEQAAQPAVPLTTCNCRWNGEKLVQQCTLHEAWRDAIRDWAARAKKAELKLAARATPPAQPAVPLDANKGAPAHPTSVEALQALEYLYQHPRSDAFTEYTALRRFIEQATPPAQVEPIAYTVAGEVTNWARDFSKYRTQHYVRPVYAATPEQAAQPAVPQPGRVLYGDEPISDQSYTPLTRKDSHD